MPRFIRWFETTYPAPEEDETDWCPDGELSDEGEESCEPDAFDLEDGLDAVALAVRYLKPRVVECSSYPWRPGAWWSTEMEQDIRTGDYSERTFHLYGFSDEEEGRIAEGLR